MRQFPDRRQHDGAEVSALWLAAATLYFVLATATIHLTSDGSSIATVWPANAVLVALLLSGPRPRWMVVLSAGLVGNLAANWITRSTISGPLLYSLANGLEVVVAVKLMRAEIGVLAGLRSTGNLLRFIAVAGIAAPMISGLVGAGTAALIYAQPFGKAAVTWVLSDALGLLVFTPIFSSIFDGDLVRCLAGKGVRRRLEALALLGTTAVVAWLVFFVAALPALFVLYAPVMLVTFRVGPLGTKMAVMIIAVIGAYATDVGAGPLTMMTADPEMQAHLFQASLAIMLLTCLPVAAEIDERNRLVAELADAQRQAAEEALTDALTGVLNRRGFERAAAAILSGDTTTLYCIAIDIDRFKPINDRWGHHFGDTVLQRVAEVLRSVTRPSDLVGRLGGDEFALIVRMDDQRSIEALCARLQAALRLSPVSPDAQTSVIIGVSCGAAAAARSDRFDDVHRRADLALYTAKQAGRNTYRLASSA